MEELAKPADLASAVSTTGFGMQGHYSSLKIL